MLKFLEGYKTISGALVVATAGILFIFRVIDKEQFEIATRIGEAIAIYGFYDFFSRKTK